VNKEKLIKKINKDYGNTIKKDGSLIKALSHKYKISKTEVRRIVQPSSNKK
jgi:Mor family transcriptional regulator